MNEGDQSGCSGCNGQPRAGFLSIGAFSAASRLSQKALRLYDRHGLLRPALTDPCSGYRYYRAEQLTAAKRILLLREMEMPLARIRRVLAATPSEAACMVRTFQQEREARLSRGRRSLDALLRDLQRSCDTEGERTMDENTTGQDGLTVAGTEVAPQTVIGISRRIKVDALDTHYRESLARLRALVGEQSGVEEAGQPFAVYYGPVNHDDDGPMEVCLPVRGAVTPTGNVTLDLSRMSAGRMALEREPMDLAELAREVVARHADQASAAGCSLTVRVDEAPAGEWDRQRLDRVLTNLVSIAL